MKTLKQFIDVYAEKDGEKIYANNLQLSSESSIHVDADYFGLTSALKGYGGKENNCSLLLTGILRQPGAVDIFMNDGTYAGRILRGNPYYEIDLKRMYETYNSTQFKMVEAHTDEEETPSDPSDIWYEVFAVNAIHVKINDYIVKINKDLEDVLAADIDEEKGISLTCAENCVSCTCLKRSADSLGNETWAIVSDGITVKNLAEDYIKTVFTVNKSNLNLKPCAIKKVNLVLNFQAPYSALSSCRFYYGDNETFWENIWTEKMYKLDITEYFNSDADRLTVECVPYKTTHLVIESGEGNSPYLEIEYDCENTDFEESAVFPAMLLFDTDGDDTSKKFEIAGGAYFASDVISGETFFEYTDVAADSSELGVGISRTLTGKNNSFGVGAGFGLNLHERIKPECTLNSGRTTLYSFIGGGKRYNFDYNFYLTDGDKKKYLTKKQIKKLYLAEDGLFYRGKEVNAEAAEINGFVYGETMPEKLDNTEFYNFLTASYLVKGYVKDFPVRWLSTDGAVKGYNSDGFLSFVCDSSGKRIIIRHAGSSGRIESVESGKLKMSFVYSGGLLSEITDARGRKLRYSYYADKSLKSVRRFPAEGEESYDGAEFAYSVRENEKITVKSVENTDRYATFLTYDNAGKLINIRTVSRYPDAPYPAGVKKIISVCKIFYYDGLTYFDFGGGNKEIYAVDGDEIKKYLRTEHGIVAEAERYFEETVTAYNKYSAVAYDLNKYGLAEFVFRDGTLTKIEACENGLPLRKTVTDKNEDSINYSEFISEYVYGGNNLKREKSVKLNCKTEVVNDTVYEYNTSGAVIGETTLLSGEKETDGEKEFGLISETVKRYEYDEAGRLTKNSLEVTEGGKEKSGEKFVTEYEYTDGGYTVIEKNLGAQTRTAYYYDNTSGMLKKCATGQIINGYKHDEEGNIVEISGSEITGAGAPVNAISYKNGVVRNITGSGNSINYAYDNIYRPDEIKLNNKTYADFTYITDREDDAEIVHQSNALHNVSWMKAKNDGSYAETGFGQTVNCKVTYNASGNPVRIENTVGNEINISYDEKGNVTEYTDGDYKETYAYDEDGVVSSVTYEKDGKAAKTEINQSKTKTGRIASYLQSDIYGRYTGKNVLFDENETEDGIDIKYIMTEKVTYKKTGKYLSNLPASVEIESNNINSINEKLEYGYDASGNIVNITVKGNNGNAYENATEYAYDSFNRLTHENYLKTSGDNYETWLSYNADGNITSKRERSVENGKVNDITYQYTYEADKLVKRTFGGNEETFEYNALGNPVIYRGKAVSWEDDYKLKSYNGVTYHYDGMGRLTGRNNEKFTYDSAGRIKYIEDTATGESREFIYDSTGIAGMSCSLKYGNNYILFLEYVFTKDIHGNVTSILDNNGLIVVKYEYDAWGKCRIVVEDEAYLPIAHANPFRYRGYFYDEVNGLYYLQTRFYDPELCRFISPDSIDYVDPTIIGGVNIYSYCNNNPVMYIDPDGHVLISFIVGFAISVALGFAVSTISQGFQYGWDNINYIQAGIDGLFAGMSAILATTGIGIGLSMGIGAVMGFSQYAIGAAFHNEQITLAGSLSSLAIGLIAGAFSGAGATNAKVLANGMTGRADTGIKALITTASKYGLQSIQYKNVMNLYGKAINIAVQNTINKAFTKSIVKIWSFVCIAPTLQWLIQTGIS